MRKVKNNGNYSKLSPELHQSIARLYASGQYTTEYLAKSYHVSSRSIQRIAKKHGVIRSQADANRVAAPLKHYRTIPIELRVKRKHLSLKKRFEIISARPFCTLCGMRSDDGVRLEVDHIDEDATNNADANLQVLCNRCNLGKSHMHKFA
jgi:hypothetical protein